MEHFNQRLSEKYEKMKKWWRDVMKTSYLWYWASTDYGRKIVAQLVTTFNSHPTTKWNFKKTCLARIVYFLK